MLLVLIPALFFGVLLDLAGSRHFGLRSVYTTSLQLPIDVTKGLASRLLPSVVIGNLFFLQTLFVPTAGTNIALWSLASEFWYYLMFPLVVLAINPRSAGLIRLTYLLAFCASLLFVGWRIAALFPLWALGAIVAFLPAIIPRRYITVLTLLGTGLLVAVMIGVRKAGLNVIPAWYAIGTMTCALIYVITHNKTVAQDTIYRKVAGYFSRISYSLYLFHLPMAVFICGILDNPWHTWPKDVKHLSMWALSDAVILLVVSGLWKLFEARTDEVRSRIFSSKAFLKPDSPLFIEKRV